MSIQVLFCYISFHKGQKMKLLLFLTLSSSLLFSSISLPAHFQAKFYQKITNPKGKVISYSGNVRFSQGTLFKWSYKKPSKKEVCTNGSELRVVDHDLEQVSKYFISKGLDIAKVLRKAKLHSQNIYIASYENKKYTIQIHKNKLHSIAYFDDLDNKVQIVFKSMRYGKGKLKSKSMQCYYPKSYDVIQG